MKFFWLIDLMLLIIGWQNLDNYGVNTQKKSSIKPIFGAAVIRLYVLWKKSSNAINPIYTPNLFLTLDHDHFPQYETCMIEIEIIRHSYVCIVIKDTQAF